MIVNDFNAMSLLQLIKTLVISMALATLPLQMEAGLQLAAFKLCIIHEQSCSHCSGVVSGEGWPAGDRGGPQPHPADQRQVVLSGMHSSVNAWVGVVYYTVLCPQMTMRLGLYAQVFTEALKSDFKSQAVHEPAD